MMMFLVGRITESFRKLPTWQRKIHTCAVTSLGAVSSTGDLLACVGDEPAPQPKHASSEAAAQQPAASSTRVGAAGLPAISSIHDRPKSKDKSLEEAPPGFPLQLPSPEGLARLFGELRAPGRPQPRPALAAKSIIESARRSLGPGLAPSFGEGVALRRVLT